MANDAGAGQPLSLLVVDDNPDDLTVFTRAVRAQGWKVSTANSGRTGLDQALGQRFDLIVLDYNLGDMTGTEVLLRLKERGIQSPVLIQSGLGSDFIVARALTLGAEGFVAKDSPSYDQDVVSKVRAALQRARAGALGVQRRDRRESIHEVETVLDALMDRSRGAFVAVGFASPDGFQVSTRFRTTKRLSPETICAMVASAASTCNFLGEGLNLPTLRLVVAEFGEGHLYVAPVAGFGVLFAATAEASQMAQSAKTELEFAAKELAAILAATTRTEQYSY